MLHLRLPPQKLGHALCRRYSSGNAPDRYAGGLSNLAKALLTDVERMPKDEAANGTSSLLPSFQPVKPDIDEAVPAYSDGAKPSTCKTKRAWTAHEKQQLIALAERHNQGFRNSIDWEAVQRHFADRTLVACRSMYYAAREDEKMREQGTKQIPKGRRVRIDRAEQDMLQDAVVALGEHSWTRVCDYMQERTGLRRSKTAYRNLWFSKLCPKAQAAPKWTACREEQLRKLATVHGPDEVFLAYKFFPEFTPWFLGKRLAQMEKSRGG